MEIPKYSDLVPDSEIFDGDKVSFEKIANKTIIIIGYKFKNSRFNKDICTHIHFYFKDDETKTHYVYFTGSQVIKSQLEKIDKPSFFGLETTIKKINKYICLN